MRRVIELGFIERGTGKHQSNTVYYVGGVAPSITTFYPPYIVEEKCKKSKGIYTSDIPISSSD